MPAGQPQQQLDGWVWIVKILGLPFRIPIAVCNRQQKNRIALWDWWTEISDDNGCNICQRSTNKSVALQQRGIEPGNWTSVRHCTGPYLPKNSVYREFHAPRALGLSTTASVWRSLMLGDADKKVNKLVQLFPLLLKAVNFRPYLAQQFNRK